MKTDLSATEAAHILGVSLSTLYAYVSRGLLTSSGADATRSKRYPREAVLRLAARKADGKRAGHAVAAAMNWGVPVLETRISRIADGQLHYRGHDALQLADGATLEQTALLLWGESAVDYFAAAVPRIADGARADARGLGRGMPPLMRAMSLLPVLAHALPPVAADADQLFRLGAQLMRLLAGLLLDADVSSRPLHEQVARAWGVDDASGDLIRAALVLLADHELNTSTFSVRCVISTGAALPAALGAGLAALSGPLHGGDCVLSRVMLDAALAAPDAERFLVQHCGGGSGELPGFGHPLYPAGDPRAGHLLARLARSPAAPKVARILAAGSVAARLAGAPPNADFALAALACALDLPADAAPVLFALARSAGWIAHAAEQLAHGSMIRPRARYIGRYEPVAGRDA